MQRHEIGARKKIVELHFLDAEIIRALESPDVRPKIEDNGYAVIGGTPEEFRALIRDGIARFGTIIKAAGIEPQ